MKRIAITLATLALASGARAQENPELARQFLRCAFYLVSYGKFLPESRQLESLKARVTLFSAIGAINASSQKFVGDELVPAGRYVNGQVQVVPENEVELFLRGKDQECTALMREHWQTYFALQPPPKSGELQR